MENINHKAISEEIVAYLLNEDGDTTYTLSTLLSEKLPGLIFSVNDKFEIFELIIATLGDMGYELNFVDKMLKETLLPYDLLFTGVKQI